MTLVAMDTRLRLMQPILLADEQPEADGKVSSWIQVAKAGRWDHPIYDVFEITLDDFENMIRNFELLATHEIMVDYNHMSFAWEMEEAKAAGWARELEIRGDGLWARVDWTPKARTAIADEEYRYISPEFDFNVEDKEITTMPDGTDVKAMRGTVLFAIGLVNRPFLEGMAPVELRDAREPFVMALTCARRSDVTPGTRPENQEKITMNDDRIREILGLEAGTDVTDDHRAQAFRKLDEENAQLREAAEGGEDDDDKDAPEIPDGQVLVDAEEHEQLVQLREAQRGSVLLSKAEVDKLKADADAGRQAKTTLELSEREHWLREQTRGTEPKITPAEVEGFMDLCDTEEGFAKVKKLIEAKPVLTVATPETGAGDGVAADADKVKQFVDERRVVYLSDPHNLDEGAAQQKALADAKREFGQETYDKFRYGTAA